MTYPELVGFLTSLFEPDGISVDFAHTTTYASGRKDVLKGTIWYFDGRLFVEHSEVPSDQSPWEYGTYGDKLLRWRVGGDEAVSLTRVPGDTAELLIYLIDPGGLGRVTYFYYLRAPQALNSWTNGEQLVLRWPEDGPLSGMAKVVYLNPVWFAGWMNSNAELGRRVSVVMERPRPIRKLPDRLNQPPEGVAAEPSTMTVYDVMEYL